jgi:hypothetical protein
MKKNVDRMCPKRDRKGCAVPAEGRSNQLILISLVSRSDFFMGQEPENGDERSNLANMEGVLRPRMWSEASLQ